MDGLEIVASLYLVAQRRAGRPTGWVPWVALVVGTVASLAANVAVGGDDPIGKALAGWPALSMLVSVKLLFSMIDHGEGDQRTVRDDQRPSADRPSLGRSGRQSRTGDRRPDRHRTGGRADGPSATGRTDSTPVQSADPGDPPAFADMREVAHLIPAARAARAVLAREGRSLSLDGLADAMRDEGHGVSNARASLLLKMLREEGDATSRGAATAMNRQPGVAA